MDQVIFSFQGYELILRDLIAFLIAFGATFLVYFGLLKNYIIPKVKASDIPEVQRKRLTRIFRYLFFATVFFLAVVLLKLNFEILPGRGFERFNIKNLANGLIIIQTARLFHWIISNVFIHNYFVSRDLKNEPGKHSPARDSEATAISSVQYIVYAFAIIFILRTFNWDFILFDRTINNEVVNIKVSNIINVILTFLIARLVIWLLTQIFLYRLYKDKGINLGGQFAINQLLKYIIYIIAFVIALQYLGINMTLILGGAAALLVGVGLGLQQTFNDFFSGIVLLFERSVAVGDTLHVEGQVGIVKEIGLRSSLIETRDMVTVIVPNSVLVNQKVNNWTHFDEKVRFSLSIGVAYGSDAEKLKQILIDIAKANPYILDTPTPFVRFIAFGESALEFTLFFYSTNYLVIEDIKSDLRFQLNSALQEAKISIPYPHRVILNKDK